MMLTPVLCLISFCSREVSCPWTHFRSLHWHDAGLVVGLPEYFFLRDPVLRKRVLLFLPALARCWQAHTCHVWCANSYHSEYKMSLQERCTSWHREFYAGLCDKGGLLPVKTAEGHVFVEGQVRFVPHLKRCTIDLIVCFPRECFNDFRNFLVLASPPLFLFNSNL